MGNFCTRKLTFSSRKLVLFVKKCHSTFNARHLSPFGMTKKLFCALARIFWPSAHFWDFFGLQKAFGLLQAKKIPKTALRPKNLAAAQTFFFLLPHVDIVLHFNVEIYHSLVLHIYKYMYFPY